MSIANEDLRALQAYVTASDSNQYDSLAAGTVVLDLTHSNLKQRHAEVRFDLRETIADLRQRIHQKTGTPPHHQHLLFLRGNAPESGVVADVAPGAADDAKMLGYYSPTNGQTVHCIDVDPHSASRGGRYEDTSLVEKFRLTDEEYDKRRGTLRDWSRKKKEADPTFNLARHAREHRELMEVTRQVKLGYPIPDGYGFDDKTGRVVRVEKENVENDGSNGGGEATTGAGGASSAIAEEHGPETVDGIVVGGRCEIQPGGRRGTVAFAGEVPEIGGGGHWVGVRFDEPVGRTDGTVGRSGKRYFDAGGTNMGGFLRGKNVRVGDFPERDIMDEFDSSDGEDEL